MAKRLSLVIMIMVAVAFMMSGTGSAEAAKVSKATKDCLQCHKSMDPGIVVPWEGSAHSKAGIGCFECHEADKADKDAMTHNGYTIAVIVSPKDCGKCHADQQNQMTGSHHAKANKFSGSLDNVLGRVVTGEANFDLGCASCHGSDVLVGQGGKLVVGPWPNTGIGRLNPDGTNGACTACHMRHSFGLEQVRNPKTCGKCHQGPDHPQIEIFELSKHGIMYDSAEDEMNLGSKKWVLGEDYFQAPNCVTCHMGASRSVASSHDVGARLYWTLRPIVSKPLANADQGRATMKKVCNECHESPWVDGFFTQFDRYVELYNDKFAIPANDIMKFLKDAAVTDSTPFNEQVEIDFWHLWHHEGRRGRHGASMMAPDWSHWHGIYEVALNFYFHMLPNADKAVAAKGDPKVEADWKSFKGEILGRMEHKWKQGLPKEELQKIVDFYQKRYGKQ